MDIVSYSERKLTLEMTFRAKTDVTNAAKMTNDVSTFRYARSFERLQLRTSVFKKKQKKKKQSSFLMKFSFFTAEIDLC